MASHALFSHVDLRSAPIHFFATLTAYIILKTDVYQCLSVQIQMYHHIKEEKLKHHWSLHFDDLFMFIWQHCELAWCAGESNKHLRTGFLFLSKMLKQKAPSRFFRTFILPQLLFFLTLKKSRHSQLFLSISVWMFSQVTAQGSQVSVLYKLCAGIIYKAKCGAITCRKPGWLLSNLIQATLSSSKA